jgi:hypothetical protein
MTRLRTNRHPCPGCDRRLRARYLELIDVQLAQGSACMLLCPRCRWQLMQDDEYALQLKEHLEFAAMGRA